MDYHIKILPLPYEKLKGKNWGLIIKKENIPTKFRQ